MKDQRDVFENIAEVSNPFVVSQYFYTHLTADIQQLNQLIDSYNGEDTQGGRIAILKKIAASQQSIENKYSSTQIEVCPRYRSEINHKLYSQLQQHLQINGLTSIQYLRGEQVYNTFSETLANLPVEALEKLLETLLDEDSELPIGTRIQQLENVQLNPFLESNEITFLGGTNSKNFKITPSDGSAAYVLKVDNRLGAPSELEFELRKGPLANTLTTVHLSRQGFYEKVPNFRYPCRNLLVSEYVHAGDLDKHRKSVIGSRINAALSIYSQMAEILQNIQNEQCVFPDMKNSNWLIEADGRLRIADLKSFLRSEGEILNLQKLEPEGYFLTDSKHLRAPEVNQVLRDGTCRVDSMHAFMLGKNLYQYLSACDDKYLLTPIHK